MNIRNTVLLLVCAAAFSAQGQKTWKVDASKSTIAFNKFDDDVIGSVSGLKADVKMDLDNPSKGFLKASVDVLTLETGIADRDDHLMEDDFFAQKGNPQIVFESTSIVKTESGYLATGTITIKGVSKQVVMPFIFDAEKSLFVGRIKIHTADFGVMGDKANDGDYNTVVRLNIAVQ
jgi:polyisoprenoid-binding protein YceI